MPTLTRPAAVQVFLQILLGQFQTGRAAIHDRAERRAVAFPKSGHRKQFSNRITGHENTFLKPLNSSLRELSAQYLLKTRPSIAKHLFCRKLGDSLLFRPIIACRPNTLARFRRPLATQQDISATEKTRNLIDRRKAASVVKGF